jgi:hypothetical protein
MMACSFTLRLFATVSPWFTLFGFTAEIVKEISSFVFSLRLCASAP